MPAAKLCSSETLDAMKTEEGNDSLDTFIRQAIGKEEPILPFTRTAESPVQWIQLLHALDQPDLPGWPLLTPVKAQMQKCEKCSREFCSSINYRRHIRVHRKSLNVNKEFHKNRDLLAAFWDKISLEQANDIVSFDDVMLKEIPGPSLIRALASSLQKTGIWALPPIHVRAGNTLLDIIQANPSRPPISSRELFNILDETSERTFLCAGTAESVQKYVFNGETAQNCLELKNIIACASFVFEQQLVKVWIADKDAEALRCHKLLVEEEEAAQKRQALLLEKKRQKKLRKEQKLKEQFDGSSENIDVNVDVVDGLIFSAEVSGPSSPSDSNSNPPDMPTNQDSCLESTQPETKESNEEDIKQGDDYQTTKPQMVGPPNGNRQLAANRWQAPKSQRGGRFGLNPQPSKSEPVHKPGPSKDRNLQNGTKIWAKKLKPDTDGENLKPPSPQGETSPQIENNNNCELLIGSIPVTLNNSVAQQQDYHNSNEHAVLPKKNVPEKLTKANNRVASKHWRPVRHGETKSALPLDRGNENSEGGGAKSGKVPEQIVSSDERSEQSQCVDGDLVYLDNRKKQYSELPNEKNAQQGCLPFSKAAAKEFLAQRWKEAIESDHVVLVLSEPKPPVSSDVQHESSTKPNATDPPGNQKERNIQVKISKKAEKGVTIKYIPKQK